MQLPAIKFAPSDLWRWKGKIDRGPYLAAGIVLFVVKFLFDRYVSWTFFHRQWSIFDYFIPARAFDIASFPPGELQFYLTMLLVSLPFAWTGSVLTLRRLRAAQMPLWLVSLFFIPAVNVIFFKILSSMPTREDEELRLTDEAAPEAGKEAGRDAGKETAWTIAERERRQELAAKGYGQPPPAGSGMRKTAAAQLQAFLDQRVPEDTFGAAVFGALAPQPFAYALTIFCINILQNYGWGLFVALPFTIPLISVILFCWRRPREIQHCLFVSWFSLTVLGGCLFLLAAEGALCLVMAAPLAYVIASMGGALGYLIMQTRNLKSIESTRMIIGLLAMVPILMGAEYAEHNTAPLYAVSTTVDIQAPPETVWENVVAFAEIPPPGELMFRLGVAHPVRARIFGKGAGAIRHCEFSTGTFVEPITVWDEPRRLSFSVTEQPAPMRELSFDTKIHPAHLHNYLVSKGGQFLLKADGHGGTTLAGTTWYSHHMWPDTYWKLWSDQIIHRIHLRVLNHIKTLCEPSPTT